MKRILLTISYDGTSYHGWQVQPNGVTVQQVLQDALTKLLSVRPNLTGCSRTDAGVHAKEFYCHLDCEDKFPENAFLKGLNSLLPNDIAVIGCSRVEDDFHARYDAKGKQYIYSMYLGAHNPFASRYNLHLEKKPDIRLMDSFCKGIIGTHDFAGFSSSHRTVQNTVRTVTECSVYSKENYIFLQISADGFLYNMVRIIAGTALAVGYGTLKPVCFEEIFESKDRSKAGCTLPPHALILNKVFY